MTDLLLSVDSITKALPAAVVTANQGTVSGKLAAGDDSRITGAQQGINLPAANGTDDTTAIQAILTAHAGKRITGRAGSSYKISAPLVIATGTTLDVTGCTITLLAGSNCRMIQNVALFGSGARDTDIHIIGGFWDRGANGGTGTNDSHSIVLHRADRTSVTDLRFTATGACKYAVYFCDVTYANAERLDFTSTSDGVHVTGPASKITVRDIVGTNDDDVVSFTGRDYAGFELTAGGGNISEILVDHVVCRGGVDPNTVKLLPGAGMTLSNAVVRNISGSPATSAVVLYSDTVQASTTGGILNGVIIDGVTGTPGQRYVLVSHPDVRGLTIRNVAVTSNVTRALSFNGGMGDVVVDGVTASDAFLGSLIHVGSSTTIGGLTLANIAARFAVSNSPYLCISDGAIAHLQMSNIRQIGGYSSVILSSGTCPLISINGAHSTAANSLVRISASTPVEVHVTGVTSYPATMVTVLGATAAVVLHVGTVVDSANVQLARTGTQALRAIGSGAKVNAAILTPTAGDIVTNTNAALACGVGPVISNGTLWKNLYTGATT